MIKIEDKYDCGLCLMSTDGNNWLQDDISVKLDLSKHYEGESFDIKSFYRNQDICLMGGKHLLMSNDFVNWKLNDIIVTDETNEESVLQITKIMYIGDKFYVSGYNQRNVPTYKTGFLNLIADADYIDGVPVVNDPYVRKMISDIFTYIPCSNVETRVANIWDMDYFKEGDEIFGETAEEIGLFNINSHISQLLQDGVFNWDGVSQENPTKILAGKFIDMMTGEELEEFATTYTDLNGDFYIDSIPDYTGEHGNKYIDGETYNTCICIGQYDEESGVVDKEELNDPTKNINISDILPKGQVVFSNIIKIRDNNTNEYVYFQPTDMIFENGKYVIVGNEYDFEKDDKISFYSYICSSTDLFNWTVEKIDSTNNPFYYINGIIYIAGMGKYIVYGGIEYESEHYGTISYSNDLINWTTLSDSNNRQPFTKHLLEADGTNIYLYLIDQTNVIKEYNVNTNQCVDKSTINDNRCKITSLIKVNDIYYASVNYMDNQGTQISLIYTSADNFISWMQQDELMNGRWYNEIIEVNYQTSELATLTIVPKDEFGNILSDAIVMINGVAQSSITVQAGTVVSYTISLENYETITDNIMVIGASTINPIMYKSYCKLIVNTYIRGTSTPIDTTIRLVCGNYQQIGNTITVPSGSIVNYRVYKDGWIGESGNITVINDNQVYNAYLEIRQVTLTIKPTPADATVVLTATGFQQVNNSITVDWGTSVNWSVSKTDYVSQSGTKTAYDDTILEKELEHIPVSLTVNVYEQDTGIPITDATISFVVNNVQDGYISRDGNTIVIPYNAWVSYTVSKESFYNNFGNINVVGDTIESVILYYKPVTVTIIVKDSVSETVLDEAEVSIIDSNEDWSDPDLEYYTNPCNIGYNTGIKYKVTCPYYNDYPSTTVTNITTNRQIIVQMTRTYNTDVVVFESSVPDTYSLPITYGNYNVILVGGGSGGFVANWNNGDNHFSIGGSSGGYTNVTEYIENGTYQVIVGKAGTGSGLVEKGDGYGSIPTSGGNSSFTGVPSTYAGGGIINITDYTTYDGSSTGGYGETTAGNDGDILVEGTSTDDTDGALSIYSGYGAGGNVERDYTGQESDFGYDGTSGYVKITYLYR